MFYKIIITILSAIAINAMACDEQYKPLDDRALISITEQLRQTGLLKANFIQSRHMKALKKPLQSEGKMIYAADQGLFWQMEKPFSYQLLIDQKKIVQMSDGKKQVIEVDEQPAIFSMSKVFASVLSGNLGAGQEFFEIKGKEINSTSSWELCLIPLHAPVNQWLSHINLSGDEFVKSVLLIDKQNDFTSIEFSHFEKLMPSDHSLNDLFEAN